MARFTLPRITMALAVALLLTYSFAIAPRIAPNRQNAVPDATPTASPSPEPPNLFPPKGKVFIGVTTAEGPYDFTPVDKFTQAAKHQPQVMLFSQGWASSTFDRALFDRIAERGMMPMLAWEPWDYRLDQVAREKGLAQQKIDAIRSRQPKYRLVRIARGDFDTYLRSWAEGIKSLAYPVAIRFAHEMNGDWYPWSDAVNGNRPGDYVKAWRHLHDVFTAVGASNVTWVWSPNARWDDSTPKLAKLYPGDNYVDWVGISGYYGTGYFSQFRSFNAIFKPTIAEIRTFTNRPIVITETAATDLSGQKVKWINQTFRILPRHEDIIGLIWFEANKELDWRIVSSPAAAAAFAKAVAAPRYDFTWSPDTVPRTQL